tara:strand:+ start:359 stop:649 length:291 start_codon:yes stop_codon:yes gene_type:complete
VSLAPPALPGGPGPLDSPAGKQEEDGKMEDGQMEVEQITATERYIKRIRNKRKRVYAEHYAGFLLTGETQPEPIEDGLSYLGAQAVRLQLRDILKS